MRKLWPVLSFGVVLVMLSFPAKGYAQWTADNSDPEKLGWMVGAPPAEEKTIRFTDGHYFDFPQMRWTVCNFQQLMPTKRVSRGLGAPAPLPHADKTKAINAVTFTPWGAKEAMTWEDSLSANFTDGIVVLHDGKIVYEYYAGCLKPDNAHGAMSVTKSFTGLLAEILVAEGVLDEAKLVKDYIPELGASAFGDATVRQVMDMTTGLDYSEDYADPDAEVWQHAAAGSPLPKPEGYEGPRTYYEFLQTVKKKGEHGKGFGYKTVNSDTLGWIISRVSGKDVTALLSEKIWRRIGAEQDAFYTVDSIGTPFAGGGLNAGLRDLARVGQLLLDDGMMNGKQIIPEKAVESIRKGGDKEAFKAGGYESLQGWSYRSMWWVTHNKNGAYMARGVHGQSLYIDPAARMVIARFSSHPKAGNGANDPTTLPAYDALARSLQSSIKQKMK